MDTQAVSSKDENDAAKSAGGKSIATRSSDQPDDLARSSVLVHVVELGNETLDCLRRLTALLERHSDQPFTPTQHGSVSESPTIPCPYLDAKEAAAYLGTTLSSLYGLVERKQIDPDRGPRRRYRFTTEMLDAYLKRGKKR
jgi:excisionase family DNA binding protein